MLEIREAAKKTYQAIVSGGFSVTDARWAVLDTITVLMSIAKCQWIRSTKMADDIDCPLLDDLFAIDWTEVDPRCLAWVYSDLMNPDTKVKTASIYTPEPVVKFMVRSALALSIKDSCGIDIDEFPEDQQKLESLKRSIGLLKIVDPCVGCGLFLYETWMQLCDIEDTIDQRLGLVAGKRSISLNQLHGVDINPEAIEISKRLIQFAFLERKRSV
jgi:hypothetical protein